MGFPYTSFQKGKGVFEAGDKLVRIVYLVPSDSTENPGYTLSLENAARHLQRWYSMQLGNNLTFNLHHPIVEVYKTPHEAIWYSTNPNGGLFTTFWNNVLFDGFNLTGGSKYDPDNIWVFYIDAFNACGQCGGCGGMGCVVISANDLRGLVGLPWVPICPGEGRPYTPCRYVGGLGHELGHAFGLPHPPGCTDQEPWCDYGSIMWTGYASYPFCYFSDEEKAILWSSDFITETELGNCVFDCVELQTEYTYSSTDRVSICEGDSVFLEGKYQHIAGIYIDSLMTMNGCDSVIISELMVNPAFDTTQELALCEGDSMLIAGKFRRMAGTYIDTLLAASGCDSVINTILTVNQKPSVDLGNDTVLTTLDTLLLDAGANASCYNWSDGSTEQVLWFHSPVMGSYQYAVAVVDENGCTNSDTIGIQVIPSTTSMGTGYGTPSSPRVYPNPASDILSIELPDMGYHQFSIHNCDGAHVLSGVISGRNARIDISALKNGVYFITIRSEDTFITRKVVKL